MNASPNRDATPLLPQSALAQAAAAAMPFLQPTQQQQDNYGDTAAGGFPVQLPLSPTLLRNLGDRSYDKRKGAAMEVENLIKQLQENAASTEYRQRQFLLHQQQTLANGSSSPAKAQDELATMSNPSRERIPAIIELLGNEFAFSTNANHRKGGLIGLAATAIGLMHEAHLYLDKLLPPVLHCFDDPESRVRYYACESLYNIAKVARGHILAYFNKIFDGLCKVRSFARSCTRRSLLVVDGISSRLINANVCDYVFHQLLALCRCGRGCEEWCESLGSSRERYRHRERVL